jgi:oligosaccharyltransferase complex subunit alpha (ribophorin I)
MNRLNFEVLVLSALLASCCGAGSDTIIADLVVANVHRTVDLSSHLPKISSSITLENTGKTAVRSFLFLVDPTVSNHLSFIGAVVKSGDEDQKLKVVQTSVASHPNEVFYRVDLTRVLDAGKQVTVDVETVYSHTLRPYPSQIAQSEKQFVQFTTSTYFPTPYKTTSQKTEVNCASKNIESYTRVKPVSASDSTITYGPFENKEPFTKGEIVIHYENNSPFLTVSEMTRLIEVSHWGNIAVEETLDMRHSGAQLKGPFSRYDYQRNQDGVSSVKSFKTVLPAAARDVYYRDEIGNISTSHLRELDDMVEVELRPRFPLFGGWKTHYVLGYNVPSYQYLYNSGDKYVLKMRFLDHVFDDQVVDRLTVKVILPEGASNIEFKAPYNIKREKNELHFTYLDTFGRPVITAYKDNLVDQHIQDFELHYTFQKIMLLQEPLLVVGAFYLLFLTMIIYVRLDFSITKDEASESRMRVASLIEQVQGAQDRRSALYQSYDDAINKYKASKDSSTFNTNRKKIDTDYKQLTQTINNYLSKLKGEGSEHAEKVQQLQGLDVQMRDQITLGIQYAEKLIAGKLNKQQYIDTESNVRTKRTEIYAKMEGLLSSL